MRDYSKTFLTLSILYLSIVFLLMSCEKDTYQELDEIDSVNTELLIDSYVKHYSKIATGEFTFGGDGETYHLKPKRWKHGGFKGTNKIDVFFHESFDDDNAKNELISFLSVLDNIIEDENIKFNIVNNINDADITIVFGSDVYQSLFGGSPNNDMLGQAWYSNEEMLAENNPNIVNPDLCSIGEGRFWVEIYNDLLIKHEFLHVLGFGHTNTTTIMNHYVDRMRNLKDIDEKVIYLKYNTYLDTEVLPVPGGNGFPDWLFTKEEYEVHLDNVRFTLENRFNL